MTAARRRAALLVAVVVVVAAALTGCQRATAGTRCRTNGAWATDRTYVLRCERRRWRRVVTIVEGRRLRAANSLLRSVPEQLPLAVRGTTLVSTTSGLHQRVWRLRSTGRSRTTVCDDVIDALVAAGVERLGDCATAATAGPRWTVRFESGPTVGQVVAEPAPPIAGPSPSATAGDDTALTVTIAGCGPGRGGARTAAVAATLALCRRPAAPAGAVTDPTDAERLGEAVRPLGRPDATDVPYGPRPGCPGPDADDPCGGSTTFDVYRTASPAPRGTVVWLHGGGWVLGDKNDLAGRSLLRALRDDGWSVVSANYTLLGPTAPVAPAPLQDANALVSTVRSRAGALGLDVRRVVVGGFSAGGTLAAMVGTASGGPLPPVGIDGVVRTERVDGWFSIAGALDPRAGANTSSLFSTYLDGDANPIRAALVSPVALLDRSDPPGWAVHGDRDGIAEVGSLTSLEVRAARAGAAGAVHTDRVDRLATGTELPDATRNHLSFAGMHLRAFLDWIGGLPSH